MISGEDALPVSWSLSRKYLREFCPRAAVMRYRDASGGGLSDPVVREIAAAAAVVPDEKFIREFLLRTMKGLFYRGCRRAESLTEEVLSAFYAGFDRIISGASGKVPMSAACGGTGESCRKDLAGRLRTRCEALISGGDWQMILNTPPEYRRHLPEVLEMAVGDLRCFASPLCSFIRQGKLWIVELRDGDFRSAGRETALIHRFYAMNFCGRAAGSVESFVLDCRTGRMRRFGMESDSSEALRLIAGEAAEWCRIASLPTEEIPVNDDNCPRCVFAGVCSKWFKNREREKP